MTSSSTCLHDFTGASSDISTFYDVARQAPTCSLFGRDHVTPLHFTDRWPPTGSCHNKCVKIEDDQFRSKQLGQEARRNREHESIARQPLSTDGHSFIPSSTRPPRCSMHICGAEHWIEQRVQSNSKVAPKFSTCCKYGAVMIDRFDDHPRPLYSLLMDSTLGMFLCLIFFNDQELHSPVETFGITTTLAFSPLNIKTDPYVYGPRGVYIFRI
jgi:hypothetical protein